MCYGWSDILDSIANLQTFLFIQKIKNYPLYEIPLLAYEMFIIASSWMNKDCLGLESHSSSSTHHKLQREIGSLFLNTPLKRA